MAIKLNEYDGGKLLEVQVSGKLHREDYPKFIPEFERLLHDNGRVNVLLDMHDFHGWDMGALWEDTKFDLKHRKDIDRLALVGETKWQEWMATVCRPFTSAEIRYFDQGHKADAMHWLEEKFTVNAVETATRKEVEAMKGAPTEMQ